VPSFLEFFYGVHGEDHYLLALLQIMTFQSEILTKKYPYWTLVKKPLNHFGQVVFNMIALTHGLFD
jgi:hypothetical protein